MDELSPVFERVSRYFALLSEPMRIRVLNSICQTEKTVTEVVKETGGTQTNISRHLSTMYQAGVLTRRRQGNLIYYGVADAALTEICRTVCIHIAGNMENTEARLGSADFLLLAQKMQQAEASENLAAPALGVHSASRGEPA